MKNNWQYILAGGVIILLLANVSLFARSISMGDALQKIEDNTAQLKIENLELNKELSIINSLDSLASDAQKMGFVKVATPVSLETFTTNSVAYK